MTSRPQLLFLVAVFAALALLPLTGSRFLLDLAVQVLIFSLFALSLNVIAGHVGSVSFGHAAFLALGGYSCAWLQTRMGLPLAVTMVAVVVLTALASAVIGWFCVRLNQIYFSMLTLAFSMLIWAVAMKWKAVTGGDDGFVGIKVPELLQTPVGFFWFAWAVVGVSTALLWMLSKSTMGRAFLAIRENHVRASFIGIDVSRMRLIAFVIAGVFAGLAGVLLALNVRGMFPQSAFWTQSGQVMIMVLLGGVHSFVGPILGATTLYLLESFIHHYTQYWPLVLGLILLGLVLAAPDGLVGLCQRAWRKLAVREGRPVSPPVTPEANAVIRSTEAVQ
ncbi:MAG TPA: branched-chain amino acid ABC transporter permease [Ramlibacter sp.]|nr:branched-chain amino acid ABC transporter permease [Ramlibacter sp.]